ncbi:MAG: hypothetical protein LBI18_11510 [Planctomycetaceae bacterium]|jgi:tetratricopeptide (TPR) repeat protein|nr:hypothetical protein [Planctomycetaceae bacterium]
MYRFSFFFVPVFFFCAEAVFGFTESDILFLRGLSDRNLFESVEFFCQKEFQNPNVSTIQKLRLATELVRSQTRQLLISEPVLRQELRKRLGELKTQFLGSPDELTQPELSLARIELQFQFAVAEYSLGDWQRLEADVAPETNRNNMILQARTTLFQSLEQFQLATELLETAQKRNGFKTNPALERQLVILFRSIGYQKGLAQMSLALSFPPGEDRLFSLNQAVRFLTELASLPINDPIIFRSRIELATCYRLLENYDQCRELLTRLPNTELTPELQFQAETELIRYCLAVGNLDEAAAKTKQNHPDSWIYPDYELAKLELFLMLSRRFKDQTQQQTEINQTILEQIRHIDQQFGTYWGRRARMFLGNSHRTIAEGTTEGIDAPLLKMLAEDQFQNGQYTEAVRFFELASRHAETIGNRQETFDNAVSAIAVLEEVLKRLETVASAASVASADSDTLQTEITSCRQQMIDSLRALSVRFSENPDTDELHLKAIDLASQAVLQKELPLDDYLGLLKEHAEHWRDSPKTPPLLFRAATLLENQGQISDALSILEKIPNHTVVGLDVVNTAKRCFEMLPDSSCSGVSVAEWFERRLPVDEHSWNEADVVSVLHAAEQRIQAFAGVANKTEAIEIPKRAEQLLRNALRNFPELKPVIKIQIQTMLVTVLNDLEQRKEGTEILKLLDDQQLEALSSAEKRSFWLVQVQLLAKTGKTQEAVDLLKKRLKQYPDDHGFLIVLAEILTRQNDSATLAKAVEIWTRIANQSAKNTENWWLSRERIIEIYLKQNKQSEAKKEFEILRLLYPELGGTTRKSRLETLFTQ